MPSKKLALPVLLVAGAMVAGCGAPASAPAPSHSKPAANASVKPSATSRSLTHVILQFPFYVSGEDAPFVLAKQRGYYAHSGLNVDMKAGRGSSTTAQAVANGAATFGFADAGTTAKVASKGAPIVVVACIFPKTPVGFIFQPTRPIHTAADLKGRSFVAPAGSASFQLLPAILGKAGLTLKDIKEVAVSPQAEAATYKAHPDFVVIGNNNSVYVIIRQVVPDAKYVSFARFGVNTYGLSLITNRSELKNHPAQVKAFVAASIKGWQAALADPQAAVKALVAAYPAQKQAIALESLRASFTLLHTPDTQHHPLGWMSRIGWQHTIDILHRYGGLKNVRPVGTYYTNKFVPQS